MIPVSLSPRQMKKQILEYLFEKKTIMEYFYNFSVEKNGFHQTKKYNKKYWRLKLYFPRQRSTMNETPF